MSRYYCKAPLSVGDKIMVRPVSYFRRFYKVIKKDNEAFFNTIIPVNKDILFFCDRVLIVSADNDCSIYDEPVSCIDFNSGTSLKLSRDCFKKVGKSYGMKVKEN